MADPIAYTPPVGAPGTEAFTAEDDLARLVGTLHERGALRALNGLFDRFDDVSAVFVRFLDTPEGRNVLSNGLLLLRALGRVDAGATERFTTGLAEGLAAAGERLGDEADPPGFVGLMRRLHEPDVRRALDALLTLLATLGRSLQDDGPGSRAEG